MNKLVFLFFFFSFLVVKANFTGYPLWVSASPEIKIELKEKQSYGLFSEVSILLHCPYANDYKISNDPTFKNALWRKVKPKITWKLKKEYITTVYVIFRRHNKEKNIKEISPIVHYTLDRKNLEKKIDKKPNGYINWTDLYISVNVTNVQKQQAGERYLFASAQKRAEETINSYLYDILKDIDTNSFYTIKDFTSIYENIQEKILNYLNQEVKINEIFYPSKNTVVVSGSLNLYSSFFKKNHFISLLKPRLNQQSLIKKNYYETIINTLVIDVKKMNFKPCLFPEVILENDQIIIHPSFNTNSSIPYVRYIRSLEKLNEKLKFQKKQKNSFLIIKPLALKIKEKSKIIITQRHKEILLGNQQTIDQIANGGFFILTD